MSQCVAGLFLALLLPSAINDAFEGLSLLLLRPLESDSSSLSSDSFFIELLLLWRLNTGDVVREGCLLSESFSRSLSLLEELVMALLKALPVRLEGVADEEGMGADGEGSVVFPVA